MQTARALARAVLFLLAMGAAAGGAWPAAAVPPRPAPAGAMAVAGAAGGWAGAFWGQVQRLDDFATFLAADTRAQWRGAAGDLMGWGHQALPRLDDALALPRLDDALATMRDAVAATAGTGQPVWQDVRRRLAGWWPLALPDLNLVGRGGLPAAAGNAVPGAPGAAGVFSGGGMTGEEPGPAATGAGAVPGGMLAGGGEEAVGEAEGLPGGATISSADPLPDPLPLIPGPAWRAEASVLTATGQGAAEGGEPGARSSGREDRAAQGGGSASGGSDDRHQAAAREDDGGRDGTADRDGGGAAETAGEPSWIPAVASWYGPGFYGRPTASGETFTGKEMTAAHRTMPFGTVLLVVYPETGRSVRVRINDRGPYVEGRDLDLSEAAAEALGMISAGVARVMYRVLHWGG